MENAVKTSKTQHFEFTGLGDNGAQRTYEEYLVPMRDKNQQVEILAVARDITERRRVQEALRESEDKFKYVFDHSVSGKSITLPGGEMNVNQAFCKMLGYTHKELKNRKWQEITHPEDVELTQRAVDKLVSGERESVQFTKRFIHKNGSIVWAELGSAVRRDEQGRPVYFVTTLIDITERKLAEESLRDLSERQEAILDATPDILMEVNQDKLYTWANPAGLDFFGRDVIGKTADHYFEGDQDTYRVVSPLFQGNKDVMYVESWQRRKDGKKRLLAWWCRSIRNKDGNVRGALSSAHDITEVRKAEQVLQESEQRLTSIYDTVGNVIFYLAVEGDGQYRFTSVNPAFGKVTGIPLEKVIGKRVDEIIPEPSLSVVLGKYRQAIEEKTVVRWEETTIYPTGRVVGEVSVSPVLDEDGTCTHLVGSVHDITERTMMEEALRESEERFHSLFKNMLNGFAYCHMLFDQGDPVDFTYLEVNEAFETLTGLKDVVGKKVSELIPGVRQSDPALFEVYGRVALTGIPETLENYVEGLKMWFSISVYSPRREYFVAVFDVITARKHTEEALRESEQKYRGLVTEISDGIFITDNAGRLTFANPALARIHGFSTPEELLGKRFMDYILSNQIDEVRGYFIKIISGEQLHVALTTELVRPDGTQATIEVLASAMQENGKVIGTNGVVRDITDRKQTQIVQEAVYQIASAAETTKSLDDLYPQIHRIISSVMPAENFFITLYDEAENLLRFPYFKDAADEPLMGGIQPGKGLSAYVLRTGKSLLCTQAVHDELERQGEVKLLGVASAIWLGVPLVVEGKTIGVMVVQHYTDSNAYTEREQHMLEFVSTQVAIAISRKRAEQELRESEERFRSLYENATVGIYRTSPEGQILLANPTLVSMLGYDTLEELGPARPGIRGIRAKLPALGIPEENRTGCGHSRP